jgi:hypothetical protein
MRNEDKTPNKMRNKEGRGAKGKKKIAEEEIRRK